jgi:putative ATPase
VAEQQEELGEVLSPSPEDPRLQRWLARQTAAEGERLDLLRQRFWADRHPGRLDRVLVLQARSLLWALDPLRDAAEGDVVITVERPEDRERLEAQVQLLDPLVRPQVLVVPEADPQPLLALAQPEGRFEWIVGRQPRLVGSGKGCPTWVDALSSVAAPGAHLRLLFSQPQLGPAGALRALLSRPASPAEALLDRVVAAEAQGLGGQELVPAPLVLELGQQGWQVREQEWEESLELLLAERLLERWFAGPAPYRASMVAAGLTLGELEELRRWFGAHLGARLPQRLRHGVLEGRWPAGPSPKKSPSRSRGKKG